MSKLPGVKRIREEEYDTDYSDLISKLAFILNSFMDNVTNTINGRLDSENMMRDIVTVDVNIKSDGTLLNKPQVKTKLSQIKGIQVIKAINLNNTNTYPTNSPFVSYGLKNSGVVELLNVSGLQNDSKYRLTLEIIG